ncbi:hypothetical protein DFQ28_010544 [Apophysomyces sp. BC1034]|nr:hypothetical protein DFQ30_006870 [Apophysomyces sp. BC1015]KAG0172765.1 hypothetical protein DFQ29_008232 [Apophysomyces sp. BC1021]KAG0184753.1 hypothetical protein DFQ28_010544 [Apophysomyces sp. BC1034]
MCHRSRLEQHVNHALQGDLVYVDIRGKQPVQRDRPQHLIDWLQHQLVPFLSSRQSFFSFPIVPTFMISVTGWALEYPVIYTLHSESDDPAIEWDEWEPRTNCLGGQLLTVIRVLIHGLGTSSYMLLSFSYPSPLITDDIQALVREKMEQRVAQAPIHNLRVEVVKEQVVLDQVAL